MESAVLRTEALSAYFGETEVVKRVHLRIPEKKVTSIMGPSGCGKSTLIRCFNRMHEMISGARVEERSICRNRTCTPWIPSL